MKYGRRIVRIAITRFPFEKIPERKPEEIKKELVSFIKSIRPTPDGIFGWNGRWTVRIHYKLLYVKISYYPGYPDTRKSRIYFSHYDRNK